MWGSGHITVCVGMHAWDECMYASDSQAALWKVELTKLDGHASRHRTSEQVLLMSYRPAEGRGASDRTGQILAGEHAGESKKVAGWLLIFGPRAAKIDRRDPIFARLLANLGALGLYCPSNRLCR